MLHILINGMYFVYLCINNKTPISMSSRGSKEKYKGYTIYERNNNFPVPFTRGETIDIIDISTNIGITPTQYCRMLMQPCTSCKNDKIQIDKMPSVFPKKFRGMPQVHLYCLVNSRIGTRLKETKLQMNYKISFLMGIPQDSLIGTPHHNHFYDESKGNVDALLMIYIDDSKEITMNCKIVNGQIYSPLENI